MRHTESVNLDVFNTTFNFRLLDLKPPECLSVSSRILVLVLRYTYVAHVPSASLKSSIATPSPSSTAITDVPSYFTGIGWSLSLSSRVDIIPTCPPPRIG